MGPGPSIARTPSLLHVFVTQLLACVPYAEVEDILSGMEETVQATVENKDEQIEMPVVTPRPLYGLAVEVLGRVETMTVRLQEEVAERNPKIVDALGQTP